MKITLADLRAGDSAKVAHAINLIAEGGTPEQNEALGALYELLEEMAEEIDRLSAPRKLPFRRCSNCDKKYRPATWASRWCPACSRAGKAMVAMEAFAE
jgi:hypothetical protein